MRTEDTQAYETQIRALIDEHTLEPVDLMFADSVAEWCAARGKEAWPDPLAMAVRDNQTGRAAIVMRRSLSAEQVQRVLDRIDGFGKGQHRLQVRRLDSPLRFMQHLALHELAHLLNDWGNDREDDCDGWAFERLPR